MQYRCDVASAVGTITLAGDDEHLTGLWIGGQKYFAATLSQDAVVRETPVFRYAREWLTRYFKGEQPGAAPRLAPVGSAFRQRVWALLRDIPYGQVVTYGQLAERLEGETGKPASARAVGGAVGHNPISLLIPCHRVVGADGRLTGYAAGLDVKRQLLTLEGALTEGHQS